MVEIELWHILAAIGGGFATVYTRLEITCRAIEKLKALARITHPKECKDLRL